MRWFAYWTFAMHVRGGIIHFTVRIFYIIVKDDTQLPVLDCTNVYYLRLLPPLIT
jgi:hypothetical protein